MTWLVTVANLPGISIADLNTIHKKPLSSRKVPHFSSNKSVQNFCFCYSDKSQISNSSNELKFAVVACVEFLRTISQLQITYSAKSSEFTGTVKKTQPI